MAIDNENIYALLISYITGNATGEEKILIDTWLQENDENKQILAEVSDIWDASSLHSDHHVNSNIQYQKLRSRIRKSNYVLGRAKPVIRYAAIIILSLVLGGLITHFYDIGETVNNNDETITRITAPMGSKTNLLLPDGTEVWLNAGSSLSYSDQYAMHLEREVKLDGEAYFKVAENKEKPFAVIAEEVIIRALGTSFNVKAYTDEPVISATLVEGKIAIASINKKEDEIILKPNEQIEINRENFQVNRPTGINNNVAEDKTMSKQPVQLPLKKKEISIKSNINTLPHTSWKDNKWIIENEELSSLARKLERRYAISIKFYNEKLKKIRFTGTLMEESLEQVLEVISFASPVVYRIEGANVYFDSN